MKIEDIRLSAKDSIVVKEKWLKDDVFLDKLSNVVNVCVKALSNEGCIFFCGNGGSAADAQHLAAELTGRYGFDRPPLNAEALHCDISFVTAVGNDYSFDEIYSRLIKGKGKKGDVLIGISTSGNSPNVCNAMNRAREMGISVISFTGDSGGKMKHISDIWLGVPSSCTPRIQESHILMGHIICEGIENALFKK